MIHFSLVYINFNIFFKSVTVVEDALAPHDCGNNDILVNVKAASVNVIDVEITCGYGKTLREILVATQKVQKFFVLTEFEILIVCSK